MGKKRLVIQVKIWFQNRRNKWKRQLAADMEVREAAKKSFFLVVGPLRGVKAGPLRKKNFF